jgi:hypothetical protein
MTDQQQTEKPTTETIDRLFLELSQFTRAKTGRELAFHVALIKAIAALDDLAHGRGLSQPIEQLVAELRLTLQEA